ncbi:alpha/beta hydrolase [Salsuginibacillus halophilus]|uniref:alpha/beta hydrolase n=1 Tax=Salsuginibacillus halophilus TaxID=517424 RepID=UPI0015E7DA00|nr:alpha/beta hydrolase [Salsuginibacillus halophilus]
MKHIYKHGRNPERPVLLLLHGTGGNEEDLMPLARMIDPEAAILSVRGNVEENGMPRFFKRLREGVFDHEDLAKRTDELYEFIQEAAKQYEFNLGQVTAIGYSNGANIAANLLFRHGPVLKNAILHHPMVPDADALIPEVKELPVWIGAGANDPICPPEQTEELDRKLQEAGAEVKVNWYQAGHQLTQEEAKDAAVWYGAP